MGFIFPLQSLYSFSDEFQEGICIIKARCNQSVTPRIKIVFIFITLIINSSAVLQAARVRFNPV